MADMETVCARLCLLTPAVNRAELPPPFSRAMVSKMVRCGAISGLTLKRVDEIENSVYERAEALLSHSVEVFSRIQCWQEQGYQVMLPQDDCWPENLYALGSRMPQYLFVRGNESLLSQRKIALAGSRQIMAHTAACACMYGQEIAQAGYVMVSGGAQGVDTAAQKALLENGGSLILVPALPVNRLLSQRYLQEALVGKQLLLVCDTWPDEGFSAAKALSRNHTIYALGDAAVVVAARKGVGGSWHGAVDCLKYGYTPVFAPDETGADFAGNRALFGMGAKRLIGSHPLVSQLFASGEDEQCSM